MPVWIHRAVLGGLLLTAYLLAWTPARRTWIADGAAPVLEEVIGTGGGDESIAPRPLSNTLRIHTETGSTFRYTAPAGIKFLLPACFLVLVAPRSPQLGTFFLGHLSLGLFALGLTAGGAAGWEDGLTLAGFVQTYGVDAYSLAVPAFASARLSLTEKSDS